MNLTGTVKVIGEQETFGTFTKQDVIITVVDGEYEQILKLEASGKALEEVATISVGDSIEASVNLRGREWIGTDGVIKYFTTLSAWKIKAALPF